MSDRSSPLIPRRTAITAGATGFLGLTLSKLFAAEETNPSNATIRSEPGGRSRSSFCTSSVDRVTSIRST